MYNSFILSNITATQVSSPALKQATCKASLPFYSTEPVDTQTSSLTPPPCVRHQFPEALFTWELFGHANLGSSVSFLYASAKSPISFSAW